MYRKRYSIVAKCIAMFLFVISLAVAWVGAVAIFYMADTGFYDDNVAEFADSSLCTDITFDYASLAVNQYLPEYLDDPESAYSINSKTFFSKENTNFACVIKNAEGEELLNTYDGGEEYSFAGAYIFSQGENEYNVDCYLDKSLPVRDNYGQPSSLFNVLIDFRYILPVVVLISALLCVMLFIYLMAVAGHRATTDDIVLNPFDKIPLDIYALAGLVGIGICIGITSSFYSPQYVTIIVLMADTFLGGLIALAFFYSLAARLKAGGWYKNTVIYRGCHLIWKVCRAIFAAVLKVIESLPIIWKTAAVWGAFCFINMIFILMAWAGAGISISFWFVFNAAAGVLLCIVSIWLRDIQKGGQALAHGELTYHIDTSKMTGDFKCHAEALNNISVGMGRAVDERMKSELFKTELITNVSHDLKTPLTSIINYVDLIKKENIQNPTLQQYIDVLDRQSARLKKLTEDLVEASKASSGTISVEPSRTNVAELLGQSVSEYADRLSAANVEAVVRAPEDNVAVFADGRLLWRVFDNLLGNICKYSQRGTRAYIDVEASGEKTAIIFKNISNYQLNISADELLERFVRGDSARHTEGSGLGLSIAKSLTELQGGQFRLVVDGDLFKAILTFDRMPVESETKEDVA